MTEQQTKLCVQIAVSATVLVASLFIILSGRYDETYIKWAFGMVGLVVGYWLRDRGGAMHRGRDPEAYPGGQAAGTAEGQIGRGRVTRREPLRVRRRQRSLEPLKVGGRIGAHQRHDRGDRPTRRKKPGLEEPSRHGITVAAAPAPGLALCPGGHPHRGLRRSWEGGQRRPAGSRQPPDSPF